MLFKDLTDSFKGFTSSVKETTGLDLKPSHLLVATKTLTNTDSKKIHLAKWGFFLVAGLVAGYFGYHSTFFVFQILGIAGAYLGLGKAYKLGLKPKEK